MVKQEEINAYFLEVIRFLKSEYGYTQEFIVEKANLGKSAISKIKNGENNVGDKTISKLCDAFECLNIDYFYGRSPYKTRLEKSEAQMEEALKEANQIGYRFNNPTPNPSIPDMSSVFNAALAAKDESYAALQQLLKSKEETIQSLREQLAAKDQLIAEQKSRLIDYRRIIDSHNLMSEYYFPMGVAEQKFGQNSPNVSPNKIQK